MWLYSFYFIKNINISQDYLCISLLLSIQNLIRLQVRSCSTQGFIQRATQSIERKQICQGIQYTSLKLRLTLAHLKRAVRQGVKIICLCWNRFFLLSIKHGSKKLSRMNYNPALHQHLLQSKSKTLKQRPHLSHEWIIIHLSTLHTFPLTPYQGKCLFCSQQS